MRIGKVLRGFIVGMVCLLVWAGVCRSEEQGAMQKVITEAKSWRYSLGDFAYLKKADQSFYGIGVQKDIGKYIDRIGEDWLYVDLGYLNTVGMSSHEKDYVYLGASGNAGRFVACGIEWTAKQFGAEIEMPDFLKTNMLKVGTIVATRFDKDEFLKVWDYGIKIRVIEIKF